MKSLLKCAIRRLGYELRRYAPTSSESAQLAAILAFHDIDVVFDVGANTGGFARYLRGIGYRRRIVSFEPTKAAYERLCAEAAKDELWSAATRSAIGAVDGMVEIHVAGNSESSSILEMLDAHAQAAPESSFVGNETVPLRTLDSIAPEYLRDGANLFLKIDTQGYEERVLEGGRKTVSCASILQVELSLVQLYAGQKLMPEMIQLLKDLGFDLWGTIPVFADKRNGRMLQMDGIFCRST